MTDQEIKQKALEIDRDYHDEALRKAFAEEHNYPEDLHGHFGTEFYFSLMHKRTSNPGLQALIQREVNQIKTERQQASKLPVFKKPSREVLSAYKEQLKNLGGGDPTLGEEYLMKYLE